MRYVFVLLAFLFASPAHATDGLILPSVDFSATATHEAGAFRSVETIHYSSGKLRIDRGKGFSVTILDFNTNTQCLLMVNHTFLILPLDDELYHHYIALPTSMTAAKRLGTERIQGLETTKYAFGDEGALDAAGTYWITQTGILIRREYQSGVFGQNVHHLEYLTHINIDPQPSALFAIPAGYTRLK